MHDRITALMHDRITAGHHTVAATAATAHTAAMEMLATGSGRGV